MRAAVPGRYFVCDIAAEPLPEEIKQAQFDVVVFADVLEHLDNFSTALRNLRSLLRPGGWLLVTTVNTFSFDAI